jgi:hypothetical protein
VKVELKGASRAAYGDLDTALADYARGNLDEPSTHTALLLSWMALAYYGVRDHERCARRRRRPAARHHRTARPRPGRVPRT